MAVFGFDKEVSPKWQRKKTKQDSGYRLHLECPWRLRRGEEIITGNQDFYYQVQQDERKIEKIKDISENFKKEDVYGKSLYDVMLKEKVEVFLPLKMLEFHGTASGDMRILFENDFVLEVFPVCSERMEEEWVFLEFNKKKKKRGHCLFFRDKHMGWWKKEKHQIKKEVSVFVDESEDVSEKLMKDLEGTFLVDMDRYWDETSLKFVRELPENPRKHYYHNCEIDCLLLICGIWRLKRKARIHLGAYDLYRKIQNDWDLEKWNSCAIIKDYKGKKRFDKIVGSLKKKKIFPLEVRRVIRNKRGDICIYFKHGYMLEVLPTDSLPKEQWRVRNFNKRKQSVFGEKEVEIVVVDEKNEWLSQMLELVGEEETDYGFYSGGIFPAKRVQERAVILSKEWYDYDLREYQQPAKFEEKKDVDFVVPIGVELDEKNFYRGRVIPLYQDYVSTGEESREELQEMCRQICVEVAKYM